MYAVNNDVPVNKKNKFFEQLHRETSRIGISREVIILRDLNGRTETKLDKIVGRFGKKIINNYGLR